MSEWTPKPGEWVVDRRRPTMGLWRVIDAEPGRWVLLWRRPPGCGEEPHFLCVGQQWLREPTPDELREAGIGVDDG